MNVSARYLKLCLIGFILSLSFGACQSTTSGGYITEAALAGETTDESTPDSTALRNTPSPTETAGIKATAHQAKLHALANADTTGRWPVARQPLPLAGAILPHKRIVAFYGNLYSARMGILGELPPNEMLAKLDREVANWNAADTATEAIPALHYIAVTAQESAGRDGKYRARMPFSQIDSVLRIAEKRDAIVFLDIQVGFSTLKAELPRLDTFLRMPHVHLGIDPEFSMKDDLPPG